MADSKCSPVYLQYPIGEIHHKNCGLLQQRRFVVKSGVGVSRQTVSGVSKIGFAFHFDTSSILHVVGFAELSNNGFE